jgi:hypothetical protein
VTPLRPTQLGQLLDRLEHQLGVGWMGHVLRLHRGVHGDPCQITLLQRPGVAHHMARRSCCKKAPATRSRSSRIRSLAGTCLSWNNCWTACARRGRQSNPGSRECPLMATSGGSGHVAGTPALPPGADVQIRASACSTRPAPWGLPGARFQVPGASFWGPYIEGTQETPRPSRRVSTGVIWPATPSTIV